jgi:hypothetical protein
MTEEELTVGLLEPNDPGYDDGDHHGEEPKHGTIVVIVFAPRHPDPKRFRFKLSETVGEAAKTAAEKFGYEISTPSFQTKSDDVLDRNLTLEAAGVRNGEELELVDAGGGV